MKIKKYLIGLLAINILIFAVFGGVLWNFNSLMKESSNGYIDSTHKETEKALESSSIETLDDYSKASDDFDKTTIVQGVQHEKYVNLIYTKSDGKYVSFDDLIQEDGSVTGVVTLLNDSSKATLFMDTMSLIKNKYSTSNEESVQSTSINVYKSYLAKQLGLSLPEVDVLDKYSKDNASIRSGTSISFTVGVGSYLVICTVFGIVMVNILALMLGLSLCKPDKGEITSKCEEKVVINGEVNI